MMTRTAATLLALLLTSAAPADDAKEKAAEALAKTFKDADAVFTAEGAKVKPLGQTNSIPASVFGEVTFKDA